jgi:hypothetical protein
MTRDYTIDVQTVEIEEPDNTGKFLAVEIIVCYLDHTWDTTYVYIPYPESNDSELKVKDDAVKHYIDNRDKRLIDMGTETYIGVYNVDWDEPVDENGDFIDE